jgi:hypothetical protein
MSLEQLMADRTTILESIIHEVSEELYQKWYNALPESEKNEDVSKALLKNASDSSFYVIQRFMDKFNTAADELKSADENQTAGE